MKRTAVAGVVSAAVIATAVTMHLIRPRTYVFYESATKQTEPLMMGGKSDVKGYDGKESGYVVTSERDARVTKALDVLKEITVGELRSMDDARLKQIRAALTDVTDIFAAEQQRRGKQ